VQYKLELCEALAPYSSAVLLDPIYGAAQSIAGGMLPGSKGLLVSIEESGYQQDPEGRLTTLLEGWSVSKVKRMGGSAVKLLLYYRPDLEELSKRQLETVRFVATDCIEHDIPFLVEPICYPLQGENKDTIEFAIKKSGMVIESARKITSIPIDVLKAEFPADMRFEKDSGRVLATCRTLTEVSAVPWVLLSAGADYKVFKEQVKIACQGGASGFLGGRGIWQEVLCIDDIKKRLKYLQSVAVNRFKELVEIADKYAVPWYKKLNVAADERAQLPENWYKNYRE
jgi:tagatose 1,6-diphosphate aldolase